MRWRPRPLIRLPHLARTHRARVVYGLFGGCSAALSIGIIALAAAAVHRPLLVPSLGPTAFLIFERPRLPAAAPRNIVVGHLIGIVVGEIALLVVHAPPTSHALDHLTIGRAIAAAISVAAVLVIMVVITIPHPPAAATTLIITLGLLTGVQQVAALVAAVLLLAAQGVALDRLVGLAYPRWLPSRAPVPNPQPSGRLRDEVDG